METELTGATRRRLPREAIIGIWECRALMNCESIFNGSVLSMKILKPCRHTLRELLWRKSAPAATPIRRQWETGKKPQMGWFGVSIREGALRPESRKGEAQAGAASHCLPPTVPPRKSPELDTVSISGGTELIGKLRPRASERLAQDHRTSQWHG